jgi:hypothetical protein
VFILCSVIAAATTFERPATLAPVRAGFLRLFRSAVARLRKRHAPAPRRTIDPPKPRAEEAFIWLFALCRALAGDADSLPQSPANPPAPREPAHPGQDRAPDQALHTARILALQSLVRLAEAYARRVGLTEQDDLWPGDLIALAHPPAPPPAQRATRPRAQRAAPLIPTHHALPEPALPARAEPRPCRINPLAHGPPAPARACKPVRARKNRPLGAAPAHVRTPSAPLRHRSRVCKLV